MASRSPRSPFGTAGLAALPIVGLFLQGCEVPTGHTAAAWEGKPDYFVDFQFQPFKSDRSVMSSCSLPDLPSREKCSGHGECMAWNVSGAVQPKLYFCRCYRDWADPECRTPRKSQRTAYFLSLFGGFLGLDLFYLGEYLTGAAKLATVGGLGIWWVADVVRIGSSPVYAAQFRVADDLSHGVYLVCTVGFFAFVGYLFFGVYGAYDVREKRRKAMLAKVEEDFFKEKEGTVDFTPPTDDGPDTVQYMSLKPIGLGDYGATGKSNLVPGWPMVAGGPYRNSNYYWAAQEKTPKDVAPA